MLQRANVAIPELPGLQTAAELRAKFASLVIDHETHRFHCSVNVHRELSETADQQVAQVPSQEHPQGLKRHWKIFLSRESLRKYG